MFHYRKSSSWSVKMEGAVRLALPRLLLCTLGWGVGIDGAIGVTCLSIEVLALTYGAMI